MNNLLKKITIYLFIIIIFLPIIGMIFHFNIPDGKDEKRKLNEYPSINVINNSGLKYYMNQIELYLNDHFAFRNELITMNSFVLYKYFSVIPVYNKNKISIEKSNKTTNPIDTIKLKNSLIDINKDSINFDPNAE